MNKAEFIAALEHELQFRGRAFSRAAFKRWFLLGCLGLALVVVAVPAGGLWYEWQKGWNPWNVKRLLGSAPPPGSSRQDVTAWLEQNRIKYVYFKDVTGDRTNQKTMPELAGLNSRDLSGMIRAHFYDGDIRIYFFFDADDRLVTHLIRFLPPRPGFWAQLRRQLLGW